MMNSLGPQKRKDASVSGSTIPSPPASPEIPLSPDFRIPSTPSRVPSLKVSSSRKPSLQSLNSSSQPSRSSSALSNYKADGTSRSRIPILTTSPANSTQTSPSKRQSLVDISSYNVPRSVQMEKENDKKEGNEPRSRPVSLDLKSKNSHIPQRSKIQGRESVFSKAKPPSRIGSRDNYSPRVGKADGGLSGTPNTPQSSLRPFSPFSPGAVESIHNVARRKFHLYSTGNGVPNKDVPKFFAECARELEDPDESRWMDTLTAILGIEKEHDYHWSLDEFTDLYERVVQGNPSSFENSPLASRMGSPPAGMETPGFDRLRRTSNDAAFRSIVSPAQLAQQAEEIATLKARLSELQEKNESLAAANANLSEYRESSESDSYRLHAENQRLQEELETIKRESENKARRLAKEVENVTEKYTKDVDDHKKDYDELSIEFNKRETLLKQRDREIAALQRELESVQKEVTRNAVDRSKFVELREKLLESEEKAASTEAQYEELGSKYTSVVKELKDLQQEKTDLEILFRKANGKLESIEKKLLAYQQDEKATELAAVPAIGSGIDKTITTKEAIEILQERQEELENQSAELRLSDGELEEMKAQYEQLQSILNKKSDLLGTLEGEKWRAEQRAEEALQALKALQSDVDKMKALGEEDKAAFLSQHKEMESIMSELYSKLGSADMQRAKAEAELEKAMKLLKEQQEKFKEEKDALSDEYKVCLVRQREQIDELLLQSGDDRPEPTVQQTPEPVSALPPLHEYPSFVRYLFSPFAVWYRIFASRFTLLKSHPGIAFEATFNLLVTCTYFCLLLWTVALYISNADERLKWAEVNGEWVRESLFSLQCLRPYHYGAGGPRHRMFEGNVYDGFRYLVEEFLGVPRLTPS